MSARARFLLPWLITLGCVSSPAPEASIPWQTLFDGTELEGWESISYGGEGDVYAENGHAVLRQGVALTGMRLPAGLPVSEEYELELCATRVMGTDFFCGLTFPVRDQFATLILGGWGGGLCGLSCINGRDASDNVTMSIRSFDNDREYKVRLRVKAEEISAWVDGELLFELDTRGLELSLRTEVLPSPPLSVSSFVTTAHIGPVRWRPLAGD